MEKGTTENRNICAIFILLHTSMALFKNSYFLR